MIYQLRRTSKPRATKKRLPDDQVSAETLKRREYQRRYYQLHKDKAKAYQREYHLTHKKRKGRKNKKGPGFEVEREVVRQTYNASDIMAAPPEKAAHMIDQILGKERFFTMNVGGGT